MNAGARTLDEQLHVLLAGCVDVTTEAELRQKLSGALEKGRPLIVKVGFDPTAPDIHLGHTVLLRKMRAFQDLGHRVIYVIGDFTASIGDPSGRSKARPPLTREQIAEHARTYTDQAYTILDESRTETRFNSEWLDQLGARGLIELAAKYTVARMLERRDFKTRLEQRMPISMHEFLYPLVQAYDSVILKADVELGGTDQLFNLNVGRDVMPGYGLESQVILTLPLLEGTDGVQKMSKTAGNHIGVDEAPEQIYGKVMSIGDDAMFRWYALLTAGGESLASRLRQRAECGDAHPRDLKRGLAREIVASCHSESAAALAEEHFDRLVVRKDLPESITTTTLAADGDAIWLPKLLVAVGLAESTSAARRLIRQGGVRVDRERVTDESWEVPLPGKILIQVGKRRFLHVSLTSAGTSSTPSSS